MDEGGTNLFWADRFGQALGLDDLWVKQCGNSHTGSFKDLGMTVLVSMVKQMIADGSRVRAVACASTGDTSASLAAYGAAAGIRAMVILPARQGVDRAAGAAAGQRRAGAGARHRLRRLHGASSSGWPSEEGVYLANSMNSLRLEGQKTVAIEIVQQFDWQVPDLVIIPGGNLGNVSALGAGFDMMRGARADHQRRRASSWRRPQAANPLYLAYQTRWDFEPVHGAADAGLGDPDRQPGVGAARRSARCRSTTASSSRRAEQELADAAAAPIARACSTARTPAWRWPRWRSWWRAGRSTRRSASS